MLKTIDPNQAKDELEKILAEKQYQIYYRQDQHTLADLLERLQAWINRHLAKLLPEQNFRDDVSEWISYGMVGAGIFVVLFLLILFSSRVVREKRFYAKPVGTEQELELSTKSHLNEAEQHYAAGDSRTALRHLFLAYLLYLDEKQWIVARAWKTNGEYIEELEILQRDRAAEFRKLAHTFEATWYGGRQVTAESYLDYRNQVLELVAGEEGNSDD
ncbi:DUF4129 domain-containing protein [Pseudoneobacillus sp. C159]